MSHTRLDQLADGIFAIVITILVFEIRVPILSKPVDNLALWQSLETLVPVFLSYILSFTLLFTYWRAHHFFISIYAKNVDSNLVNINGIFFMFVSLVPFTTSILGEYSRSELSVILFGSHIILIGLSLYLMRSYVLYSPHIRNPEISKREIHGSTLRTLVPIVFAFVAIILSFVNTDLSLSLLTIAVLFNLTSYSTRLLQKVFKY